MTTVPAFHSLGDGTEFLLVYFWCFVGNTWQWNISDFYFWMIKRPKYAYIRVDICANISIYIHGDDYLKLSQPCLWGPLVEVQSFDNSMNLAFDGSPLGRLHSHLVRGLKNHYEFMDG